MHKVGLVLVLCGSCLLAQTVKTGEQKMVIRMGEAAEFGPMGITTMLAGPIGTVTGAPYSAQVVTERIQVLADGNRIDESSTGSVARDTQGRMRRDEALPSIEGDKGESASCEHEHGDAEQEQPLPQHESSPSEPPLVKRATSHTRSGKFGNRYLCEA